MNNINNTKEAARLLPDSFTFTCAGGNYTCTRNTPTTCIITNAETNWVGNFEVDAVLKDIQEGCWTITQDTSCVATSKHLPSTFRFKTRYGECICTAVKKADGDYNITWAGYGARVYTEAELQQSLGTGEYWLVSDIPPAAIDNDIDYIAKALVPTCEKSLGSVNVLQAIKAYAALTDGFVTICKDGYDVFLPEVFDAIHVTSDERLVELLEAATVVWKAGHGA